MRNRCKYQNPGETIVVCLPTNVARLLPRLAAHNLAKANHESPRCLSCMLQCLDSIQVTSALTVYTYMSMLSTKCMNMQVHQVRCASLVTYAPELYDIVCLCCTSYRASSMYPSSVEHNDHDKHQCFAGLQRNL